MSTRTIERAVADLRRAQRVAQLATVRMETPPGDQLQIDFGQQRVRIGEAWVRVFLLVAVLSYSRRLFVKAFLSERQDDWREGIAAAFMHFGGVPRTLLGDNARALVSGRDRETGTVLFHPGYLAFCRDWDVQPRACAPYRARTKGKTEAGVKFVKRNGLAALAFPSFAALETHLAEWIVIADHRVHGTTRGARAQSRRLRGPHRGSGAMSAVVHARVVEQLTRLRLRYVAERLDAVLADAARSEPTHTASPRVTVVVPRRIVLMAYSVGARRRGRRALS